MILLDNPDAMETSFAIGVGAGYFQEQNLRLAEGIAHLLQASIIE